MNGHELKQRWKTGQGRFGTWITLADPAVCTVMATIGFEWVIIDAEHCPFNPQTLRDMLFSLRHWGVVPLLRIRANDDAIVKQALDWGAEGIMFPLIRTVEDAQKA